MSKKKNIFSLFVYFLINLLFTNLIIADEINFDTLIPEVYKSNCNIYSRIEFYSSLFLGVDYYLGPLGEGEDSDIDNDPIYDFKRVDCVTFCEQTIALSISKKNLDEFLENLIKIRYNHGNISFIERNHFTSIDWIPNNNMICTDITSSFPYLDTIIKNIDKKRFFNSFGVYSNENIIEYICEYIPENYISDFDSLFNSGDIIMIVTTKPEVAIAHWGFYIENFNEPSVFRHASMSNKKVVDLPWINFINYLKRKQDFIGIKVVRVYEEPY